MVPGPAALFGTTLETVVVVAVILAWVLSELATGILLTRRQRRNRAAQTTAPDRFSSPAVRAMLYLSIIIAFFLSAGRNTILPGWLFYIGVAVAVAGIALRQWTLSALGLYFTPVIAVQPGQRVVDSGPYRLVRHPSYLGILLTAAGIGLMLRSGTGVLVILALTGLALAYRIGVEERFLVEQLGDDYVRYMQRTKRLLPYIL